ncbi:MAG: hypothetical protein WBA13_07510 [Microcoleaceae cyanobacterium]
MTPSMLKKLWSSVEATSASLLVNLDDADLAQLLLRRLQTESNINSTEADLLTDYIQARLSLIRDLAEARITNDLSV